MLTDKKIMAFLATTDADKARDFYQNILGLKLIEEHEFALVFDVDGIELRIQKTSVFAPHSHTSLGWNVPQMEATIRDLTAKGISFIRYEGMDQDELGIWHPPSGVQIAWFKDPDGNLLSLTKNQTIR